MRFSVIGKELVSLDTLHNECPADPMNSKCADSASKYRSHTDIDL